MTTIKRIDMLSIAQRFCTIAILCGSGLVIASAPTAIAAILSDASCKQGTKVDLFGAITCQEAQCDDIGFSCQGRTSAIPWPLYQYCSCGSIGNPKNSSVCHAYSVQDVAGGFWIKYCTKGSDCSPLKCKDAGGTNSGCSCQ